MNALTARLAGRVAGQGIDALNRLVEAAEGDGHQAQHCRRILLAVYNSYAWPLELIRLRTLDRDLQRAAFIVIEWSTDCDRELYEYLPDGNRLMQRFWGLEKEQGE
ncbi:hypothetical protein SAMN02745148_01548 [Modicisalibacter ilicicola DSM 19980]|uniref:DUF7673 domain-containing protein n=1 Tax=Modicisalibacter ilicicola DSM 19980 TaxID=1121942 RepID=A0A1M4Y1K6_9GAMM|nr:hypothetical protein [Halomonas ilicicola]SHE99548.1 hypothetical protein SAMN02745148_01548 [Halomonas ilicicola DSM 19980]